MPGFKPVETKRKVLLLAVLFNLILEFLGMALKVQALFLFSLRCFRKQGGNCDVRELFGEAFNAEAGEIFFPRRLSITGLRSDRFLSFSRLCLATPVECCETRVLMNKEKNISSHHQIRQKQSCNR